jgi:hypothetical protein
MSDEENQQNQGTQGGTPPPSQTAQQESVNKGDPFQLDRLLIGTEQKAQDPEVVRRPETEKQG